jgi:hypothetical protein
MVMQGHVVTKCRICGENFITVITDLKGKDRLALNNQLSHKDKRYCAAVLNLKKFKGLPRKINNTQEEYCYENG